MVNFGNDELKPHFIYCGDYYFESERYEIFEKMFLTKMKKFGIKSSMLTMLYMWRYNIITKEKANEASEGKLKDERGDYEVSINDDLEMFLNNILNSKEIKEEKVRSFYTPKLTEEELKLFEARDKNRLDIPYLDNTYYNHYITKNTLYSNKYRKWKLFEEEMKKTDSKSKYILCECLRLTYSLTLEEKKKKKFALKNFCNNISII